MHTYTLVSTKPCTTLGERYLYQPLIHLPTLPWPGGLHTVWEMRTAGREDIRDCYSVSLMICTTQQTCSRRKGKENGRVSEREQSMSCLWWYLSNLIFQLVLVELNTILEERQMREMRGGENGFSSKEITERDIHVSDSLAVRHPRYILTKMAFSCEILSIKYLFN